MQTISVVLGSMGSGLFVLASFLFVLSIVVFVHELGHFLVARWCGVKVSAFSMGFGPEIFAFTDRHGTRWRLAWIPLGGYVKFMDDENGASVPSHEKIEAMTPEERSGSFHTKPLWQKASVVAAGPIANFITAIVIFALMASFVGLRSSEPRVTAVMEGTPAASAGFKAGDLIVAVDGTKIDTFNDLQRIVGLNADSQLKVTVDRDGRQLDLPVVPMVREEADGMGGKFRRGVIGIQGPGSREMKKLGPFEAIGYGVGETSYIITSTLSYIGKLFIGKESGDQLGGPIRIAEVSGQVAKIGFEPLLHLVAVISVSVGLINLFPVPLLDGGHLTFYAIEAIRRRPLSERTQEIGFKIGLALVLMLMLFATWNDRMIVLRWVTGGG
ncbi:MAG: RIP metalloprotease RseP [Vicinamibacterales bacterium]